MTADTLTTRLDPHDLYQRAVSAAEASEDPFGLLGELVAQGEFHQAPDGTTIVYGYARAKEQLRSPRLRKGGHHVSSDNSALSPEQRAALAAAAPPDPGMLTSIDDPDHARLRRIVSRAFAPDAVEQYRDVTYRALDGILAGLPPDRPVDLITDVCDHIPSQVIGHLIGVPLPDRVHFMRLSKGQAVGRDPKSSPGTQLEALRIRREMFAYIAELIESARGNVDESTPLGRLVAMEQSGENVSPEELVSLVALMYSAGFGTTVRLLSNALTALMQFPDQAALLRADPARARAATDEAVRINPPVMDVSYLAAEGAEVGGVAIAPGARVTIVLGAANRDPRVFDPPAAFDITAPRKGTQPLSFGFGTHYCLGVALSKLETDVVLTEMVTRFPDMQLVEPPVAVPSFRSREYRSVRAVLAP